MAADPAGTQIRPLKPGDDPEALRRSRWMLRVVDAPAAIAACGFPAAVSLRRDGRR